jgi:hypothetical protein
VDGVERSHVSGIDLLRGAEPRAVSRRILMSSSSSSACDSSERSFASRPSSTVSNSLDHVSSYPSQRGPDRGGIGLIEEYTAERRRVDVTCASPRPDRSGRTSARPRTPNATAAGSSTNSNASATKSPSNDSQRRPTIRMAQSGQGTMPTSRAAQPANRHRHRAFTATRSSISA